MIIENKFTKYDTETGINTRYFGKDAEDFLENINWHSDIDYLGKECTVVGKQQGIIIGIEDNEEYNDYYYIVYIPQDNRVTYVLANNTNFINTIKL